MTTISNKYSPLLQRFLRLLIPTIFVWVLTFDWIARAHAGVQIFVRSVYILLGILWILRRNRGKSSPRFSIIEILLTLYIAYSGILILRSPLQFHAIEIELGYVFYLFVFLFFIEETERPSNRTTWQFAFTQLAIIFSLFNILLVARWWNQWITISGSITQFPPFGYRLPGLFLQHPNVEAAYLNLIIPFTLVGILNKKNRRFQIGLIALLLLFLFVSFFASSRGAWLGMAGSIFTIVVMKYIEPLRRKLRYFVEQRSIKLSGRSFLFISLGAIAVTLLGVLSYQQARYGGHGGRAGIWSIAWNIFIDAPIIGHGPGSFHVLSAVEAGIPPGFYLVHAHNLLLQILGETGILGFLILIAVAVLIFRSFWQAWQFGGHNTHELIAYTGILVGMVLHQLVDYAFEAPLYTVGILYVLANLSRLDCDSPVFTLKKPTLNMLLTSLIAIYTVGSFYTVRGMNLQYQGVQAAIRADWETAKSYICNAQAQNPTSSLYSFQCGFASATQASYSRDSQGLRFASFQYQLGLEKDPFWSSHLAALASITWELGEHQDALLMMQRAQSQSPRSSLLALNLSYMYAELEQHDQSQEYLTLAYKLDPWLWRTSDGKWGPSTNALHPDNLQVLQNELPPATYYALIGWLSMDSGSPESALDAFTKSLEFDPLSVHAYAGLAKYAILHEDLNEAERFISYADFTGRRSPIVEEVRGELASLLGNNNNAFEYWLEGTRLTFWTLSAGPYYESVYSRAYIPIDFPPQVVQPTLPPALKIGFNRVLTEGTEVQIKEAEILRPWFNSQIGLLGGD